MMVRYLDIIIRKKTVFSMTLTVDALSAAGNLTRSLPAYAWRMKRYFMYDRDSLHIIIYTRNSNRKSQPLVGWFFL